MPVFKYKILVDVEAEGADQAEDIIQQLMDEMGRIETSAANGEEDVRHRIVSEE